MAASKKKRTGARAAVVVVPVSYTHLVLVHTADVGPAVTGGADLQRTAGVAAEFDLGRHCLDQVGVPLADVCLLYTSRCV